MAVWEVRDRDSGVEVDAPNWMMAIGSAMAELGSDGMDMACLICDVQSDGIVRVYDPRHDKALLIRRVDVPEPQPAAPATLSVAPETMARAPETESVEAPLSAAAAPAPGPTSEAIDPTPSPQSEDAVDPMALPEPPAAVPLATPPAFELPTSPSAALVGALATPEPSAAFKDEDLAFIEGPVEPTDVEGPPEDLAEQLFDGGMDIASAGSPAEAAAAALSLLGRFVPAESACVLGAGLNDTALRFLAVTGPAAEQVRHLTVPFRTGIAGFCHETGADLMITDASVDPRHHSGVDESSGYRTRGVVAVALRDQDGDIHGCLELLNPPHAFAPWHLDAATSVAKALATYLGPRI